MLPSPKAAPNTPFSFTPEELAIVNQVIERNPEILFRLTEISSRLAHLRLARCNPADIQTLRPEDSFVVRNTLEHNLTQLAQASALSRPDLLLKPLGSIEEIVENISTLKVLSVGPRSEAELFTLLGMGFRAENMSALDLIKYSPLVTLGDMHAMPFFDQQFDVAVLGWVLAYSSQPQKAVAEILRVTKPGAFIAVGCEYNPSDAEDSRLPGTRFYTVNDIHNLFEGKISRVYFSHEVSGERRNKVGALMTIFKRK